MEMLNLQSFLKAYTAKSGSPVIGYDDFCEYIKLYAEHHIQENEALSLYIVNTAEAIKEELFRLEAQRIAYISETAARKYITFVPFIADKAISQYEKLAKKPSLPFPSMKDVPKQVPPQVIARRAAPELFSALMIKQDTSSNALFCVAFPGDVPPIIMSERIDIQTLASIAINKVSMRLMEEDAHDYFYKKLVMSNSDREASIKLFFAMMINKPQQMISVQEVAGDMFYYWNQLCFFIKKDYEKIKDFTAEDISLLQAVNIAEQYILILKDKTQKENSKAESFKALESALAQPPYFYSLPRIGKFTSLAGRPLLGTYSEEELKEHLKEMTTSGKAGELPHLLGFTASNTKYYVYKEKVFPLISRLCAEAHDTIEKRLVAKWYTSLRVFENLPEMRDKVRFESCLQKELNAASPVLASLLALDYLPLLEIDVQKDGGGTSHIFSAGRLLPLSKLLALSNGRVMAEAKSRLPFWYSIPILNRIIALFNHADKQQHIAAAPSKGGFSLPKNDAQKRKLANRASLADEAQLLADDMIPQGSTIDRELDSYCKQWNKLITETAHNQLIEDVNALIYSYTKQAIKGVTPSVLNDDTITAMAEAILRVKNMQKITNQEALMMYVKLYILRLITNG